MMRVRLSSREYDRQRAVTDLLKAYRGADNQGHRNNAEEYMRRAQLIIGSTTSKRMK